MPHHTIPLHEISVRLMNVLAAIGIILLVVEPKWMLPGPLTGTYHESLGSGSVLKWCGTSGPCRPALPCLLWAMHGCHFA